MVINALKTRRRELNLSQLQVAELADLSINTINKMENEESSPTLDTLEKVASVLGLEITTTKKQITLSEE